MFWLKFVVILVTLYILVTLSILVHEAVHYAVARLCGVRSRISLIITWHKILFVPLPFPAGRLYPIGSMRPIVSIFVAISGPIANMCLAIAFCFVYLLIAAIRIRLAPDADPLAPDLALLLAVGMFNAYSAVRNLIPLEGSDGALIMKSIAALRGKGTVCSRQGRMPILDRTRPGKTGSGGK